MTRSVFNPDSGCNSDVARQVAVCAWAAAPAAPLNTGSNIAMIRLMGTLLCDVTGPAIPKLETIFCALHHDQTQKMASRKTCTCIASNSLVMDPDQSVMFRVCGTFWEYFLNSLKS